MADRVSTTYVYFISEKAGGPIKIGFSSDPKKRLAQIQTGHPRELMLLGVMPGGRAEEQELHRRFGRLKTFGEWFQEDPELLEFIEHVT